MSPASKTAWMNFWQPTWCRSSLVWMKSSYEMSSARQTSWNWRAMSSTYCLGSRPSSRARWGTLIGVLVVAHQEMDRAAFHAAEPGLHVGPDLLERGADVRPAVGIVDRRRDVIARLVVHHPLPRSPSRAIRAVMHTVRGPRIDRGDQSSDIPAARAVRSAAGPVSIYHKWRHQDASSSRHQSAYPAIPMRQEQGRRLGDRRGHR